MNLIQLGISIDNADTWFQDTDEQILYILTELSALEMSKLCLSGYISLTNDNYLIKYQIFKMVEWDRLWQRIVKLQCNVI